MRYVIVCGGEVYEDGWIKDKIKEYKNSFIIGVDSGASHLRRINVIPDLIIGDLDSIKEEDREYFEENTKIIRLNPIKDDTDTKSAIQYAIKNNASEIILLCGVGSRMDHSYGNILLLRKILKSNIPARIINEENEIFLKDKSFFIDSQKGNTISFFAFLKEVKCLTLKGFFYPLNNYNMTLEDSLGISNVVIENRAEVVFESGIILGIISRDKII